jgi:molybdenum cofactor cytidylyltransferase
MGFPKALLDAGNGQKFIERILSGILSVSKKPNEIIIVLGRHRERIENEAVLPDICRTAVNPDPSRGQLSSLVEAINIIQENSNTANTAGMLVCLVDHPFVLPSTIERILNEAETNPGSIIIPRNNGRKGHPVFFPTEIFKDLMDSPLDQGARFAVQKNIHRLRIVEVNDNAILKDVDTPEEYRSETGRDPG